jgi:hypothetical protein
MRVDEFQNRRPQKKRKAKDTGQAMVTRLPFLTVFGLAKLLASCAPAPEPDRSMATLHCEYGSAQNLGPDVNSSVFDGSPTVSADESELLFTSVRHPSASPRSTGHLCLKPT